MSCESDGIQVKFAELTRPSPTSFISVLVMMFQCGGSSKNNPETDEYGNKIKDGHYHSNLFVGTIPDLAIEEPSPHLMPLFYKEDEGGIPINMRAANLETRNSFIECLYSTSKVGWTTSPIIISLPVPAEEMEQTISYCMKEIDEKPESFNRVIDRKNSYF